jgi:MFS family permease
MNELTATPQQKRALPVISLVTFAGFLDTHLLIPVMSLFALELGAGVGMVGLIIGLYSIVNTPANILFGALVDRFGYKRLLVVGLIGDAVGMFFYSLCRLPVHLILVRIFHGITGGIVGPATMSAASHQGEDGRQGRNMAVYGMSLAAATLVGYGISGVLASRVSFNAVFYLGAGVMVAGVLVSLWLPGGRPGARDRTEAPGAGWRRVGDLLGRKGLVVPFITIFAKYFAFGGVVTLLPLYVKGLGMDALYVGMLLASFTVMFIVVQFPLGRLSDRFGRLWPSAAGLAIGIVALLLVPAVDTFAWLVVVMAFYGVAGGAIFPSVSAMLAEHSAPVERGVVTGVFHALLTAGVALGALAAGCAGEVLDVETGLRLCPALMAVALVVSLVLRPGRGSELS